MTAIILPGGGYAAAFGGGFMTTLGREFGKAPDTIIAGSGGAGTAAYFCAEQYDAIERAWTRHLATPRFVNKFRFWKIMDVDYLIDSIFKKEDPLEVEKIRRSKIKLVIAATRKKDGQAIFFDDWEKNDIFEILRATKSIPFISNGSVKIGEDWYQDSMKSTAARFLKEGVDLSEYDKVIVIQNGLNTWLQNIFGGRHQLLSHPDTRWTFVTNDEELKLSSIINNSKEFLNEQFQKGVAACRMFGAEMF